MPTICTTSMIRQTYSHNSPPVMPSGTAFATIPRFLVRSLYRPPPPFPSLKSTTHPCFCNLLLPMSSVKSSDCILLSRNSLPGQKTSTSKAGFSRSSFLPADLKPSVTSYLTQHALPSPIGTLLLSSTKLFDITDPDVRFALVLRVIRYVSFHPWGSLRADADRRRSSIHRIVRVLWASDPPQFQIKKFTAGGGVLWTPAIFNPSKSLRVGDQCLRSTLQPEDRFCWLATRLPPFAKNPQQQGAGSAATLVVDLTERLRAAMSSDVPTDPLQVLYDCRFLLRINPRQMPTHVKSVLEEHDKTASIKVLPFTQYYWPKVVLQRESHPDQVLAVPQENGAVDTTGPSAWISMQWVRPLDAT